jgi:DNA/RNA-binding domain of Phe-tRNA-synthetase-like protein
MMSKTFTVQQDVLDLGVRIRGAFAYGLNNKIRCTELENWVSEQTRGILSSLTGESIAQDKILAGFRAIHAKIGKTGKRWQSSPENMLTHILKSGRIPSISPIVDIYNLVSLKSKLALGAHDLAHTEGNIILRLLNGSERFIPLGVTTADSVQAGEYGYCDDSNDVLCRLEVRQVEKTKVTLETTDCFFIIQGNLETDDVYLNDAARELGQLLLRFCGGAYRISS